MWLNLRSPVKEHVDERSCRVSPKLAHDLVVAMGFVSGALRSLQIGGLSAACGNVADSKIDPS